MKRIIIKNLIACAAVMASGMALADTWTDPDTGYTWTYRIMDGEAEIYNNLSVAISPLPQVP